MERIRLSRNEKQVLRELKRGNDNVPAGMDNFTFADAVLSLTEKKLVQSIVNYEEVIDLRLTIKGYAYLSGNPRLLNPADWTLVAAIAACVAAVSATLALFIACGRL